MKIFNTLVSVVHNIEAPDTQTAVKKLTAALEAAGFDIYEPGNAFEGEEGTEANFPATLRKD